MKKSQNQTVIPTKILGSLLLNGENIDFPISTFETTLFYSINRGAKVSREIGGVSSLVIKDCMTRSAIFEFKNTSEAVGFVSELDKIKNELQVEISKESKYTKLIDIYSRVVGRKVFIRFEFETGDASGHNMVTIAVANIVKYLGTKLGVNCASISGNICVDKKVSAINSILGRGKSVIAEGIIPKLVCKKLLNTTPEKIVRLNTEKNLIGSVIAGSTCSANAHFANMLAGFYLATGQDVANIIEGSQGITTAEIDGEDLYFSVSLPNIIVGTIGNGKNIDFVKQNLELMKCNGENSAKRLAQIAASIVWCGELSLMAALTNNDELTRAHKLFERN